VLNSEHLGHADPGLQAPLAICTLCADVFHAPARVVRAHWFPIRTVRRPIEPHAHDDILQFDMAIGCRGAWKFEQATRPIQGVTLSVFYPHEYHGYEINTARPGSMLMSIKVKIDPDAPIVRLRALATHVTDLSVAQPLVRAWHRLIRAVDGPPDRSLPEIPLRFAEVACLWPTAATGTTAATDVAAVERMARADDMVDHAMAYIEQNLHRLVSLEEVAGAVGLSARQFARRFRAASGTSPGEFADLRRIDRARDLLSRSDLSVKEIARALGFSSTASFSHWFRRRAGTPASAYRNVSSGREK
jgi:AraC-like DNA-binding protein